MNTRKRATLLRLTGWLVLLLGISCLVFTFVPVGPLIFFAAMPGILDGLVAFGLWVILTALAISGGLTLIFMGKISAERAGPLGLCPRCGYDLRGAPMTATCSECGHPLRE